MQEKDVLAIIEQAAAEGWTELDLSGKGLTEIPKAIANLTNLTKLDLRSNRITKIPEAITNLTNLTRLDLRSNQIKVIPEAIANLPLTIYEPKVRAFFFSQNPD